MRHSTRGVVRSPSLLSGTDYAHPLAEGAYSLWARDHVEAGSMAGQDTGRAREPGRDTGSVARVAVMVALALVLAVTLVGGFWLTARTLALLFAAVVIAEAFAPLIKHLERWMPRALAVSSVYLVLIGLTAGTLWFVIPDLASQAAELTERLPEVAEEVSGDVDEMADTAEDAGVPVVGDVAGRAREWAAGFSREIVAFSGTLVSSVAEIVLIGFMSAYWLMSRSAVFGFVRSLVPREEQDAVSGTIEAFSGTVGGYVRGEAISAILVGVLSYIGLTIIGVEYALVLALLAAFGEFLPIVGPILAAIPAVVVALFDSPGQALLVAGFYLVLQQLESNIIIPNVMRNQADIPPLLTLVAISAGAAIGGILGALIAIPLAGVLKIATIQIAAPIIRRWTGATQAATTVEQAQEMEDGSG